MLSIRRPFLIAALFLALFPLTLTACKTTHPDGSAMTMSEQILHNQLTITIASTTATQMALVNIEGADQQEVADILFAVSAAVQSAIDDGGFDLTAARTLALAALAKSNNRYLPVARTLIDTLQVTVQTVLNERFSDASEDDRIRATRALLRSVTNGVILGATPYLTPSAPTAPAPVSDASIEAAQHVITTTLGSAPVTKLALKA